MYLYRNQQGVLHRTEEIKFSLEKTMQRLTEENLSTIFGREFVASEFQLHNLRIDTVAYDSESASFVIIEYKKGNSYSVIDQGLSYLSLLLNHKADFTQQLGRKKQHFIDVKDIDWSQSRVLIIADNFNRYQKESIRFKDLPIELRELKQFSDGIVTFNPIKSSEGIESIKTITTITDDTRETITEEIKSYDESYHLSSIPAEIIEIYEDLKNFIILLDDSIVIEYKKTYVAFKRYNKNIVDISIGKKGLKIWINAKKGELPDPYGIMHDVSTKGHHGNGDYEIKISTHTNVGLVKDFLSHIVVYGL